MVSSESNRRFHISLDGRPHTRLSGEVVPMPLPSIEVANPGKHKVRKPELVQIIPNNASAAVHVESLHAQPIPEIPTETEHFFLLVDGKELPITKTTYTGRNHTFSIIERDDRKLPVSVLLGQEGGFIIQGHGEEILSISLGLEQTQRNNGNGENILIDAHVGVVGANNGTLWLGENGYIKSMRVRGPVEIHTPYPEAVDKHINMGAIEIIGEGTRATINDRWIMQGPVTKTPAGRVEQQGYTKAIIKKVTENAVTQFDADPIEEMRRKFAALIDNLGTETTQEKTVPTIDREAVEVGKVYTTENGTSWVLYDVGDLRLEGETPQQASEVTTEQALQPKKTPKEQLLAIVNHKPFAPMIYPLTEGPIESTILRQRERIKKWFAGRKVRRDTRIAVSAEREVKRTEEKVAYRAWHEERLAAFHAEQDAVKDQIIARWFK